MEEQFMKADRGGVNVEKKIEQSIKEKLRNKLKYGLILQALFSKLDRIGIDISLFYLFREGSVPAVIPDLKNDTGEYIFEILDSTEMHVVASVTDGFTIETLLDILRSGDKCVGLKHHDEIAAFMWISFKEFTMKSKIIRLNPNEAYLWHMFTMESHRGKNLAPFLRYKSYELLKEMGYTVLYSISDYFNSPAVRFKMKLNARVLKLVLFIDLFKKVHWSFTLRSDRS